MKIIHDWKIIKQQAASGKVRAGVIYELGGYEVVTVEADFLPGGVSISARPIDGSGYLPEIYTNSHFKGFQELTIQTTSWGALSISEIDKVLEAYMKAQLVAKTIEGAFPECFRERSA